jgi:hypothetical protein
MKNFMKIALENSKDGKVIDHRTFAIDKGQRYFKSSISDLFWLEIGMISFKEIYKLLHSLELLEFSYLTLCFS